MGKNLPKTPERSSTERSSVPFGFETVPFGENTECPSHETTTEGEKELWLIKVPMNFDASELTGKTIVLNGAQDISINGPSEATCVKKKYEVISKPISSLLPSSFKVLLPSHDSSLWKAKTFSGDMTVVQSIRIPTQDSPGLSKYPDHVHIEAPDISCRWKPFGYKKPLAGKRKATQVKGRKKKRKKKRKSQENRKGDLDNKKLVKKEKIRNVKSVTVKEEKKKHKEKAIKQEKIDKIDSSLAKKIKLEKSSPLKKDQKKMKVKRKSSNSVHGVKVKVEV